MSDKVNSDPLRQAKVLIVDDQSINTELLSGILEDDYQVLTADSGKQAIELCHEMMPDLILLDVMMPGMDGLQTCRILKSDLNTRNIPVIFVTAVSDQNEENECWQAGGIDFLNKPVNPLTLHHRVKAQLTIKLQSDVLRNMAYMDGLTHIYNRRYFDDYYAKQLIHAQRSGEDLSVLLVDIDYFKQYNDQYGHLQGDKSLKAVATQLQLSLNRPLDIVARYGGEEFICVLPATDIAGARAVAERLLKDVRELGIEHLYVPAKYLSISMGIASYQQNSFSGDGLIKLADKHLYQAKTGGRNQFYG